MKSSMLSSLLVALGVSLSLVGCQNEGANLTAPAEQASNSPVFLELPGEPDLAKALYDEEIITASLGGDLTVSHRSWYSSVRVYMNVHFDPGTVSQDFKASLATDTQYLTTDMAMTFGPHGTNFLKPAKLTLRASGLNLTAFRTFDADRDGIVCLNLYYTSDGSWKKMNGSIQLNLKFGTIEGTDVELPHFSRYGFGI